MLLAYGVYLENRGKGKEILMLSLCAIALWERYTGTDDMGNLEKLSASTSLSEPPQCFP